MSFRCCSSPRRPLRRRPRERRRSSCASRRATASRSWPRGSDARHPAPLLPDGRGLRGAEALGRRAASTAMAITASPWPLPWRRGASGTIEIIDVANVATSFPDFPQLARSGGLCSRVACDDARCAAASTAPVVTIDGPSGAGKGTISRRWRSRFGWHLLDSGALYRLVAVAGARHGLAADDVARTCSSPATCGWTSRPRADGSERILLDGQEVTAEVRAERPGRAPPGSRPGRRCGRRCWRASAPSPSPRVWSPMGGIWARSCSPGRTEDLPDRERRGTGLATL